MALMLIFLAKGTDIYEEKLNKKQTNEGKGLIFM